MKKIVTFGEIMLRLNPPHYVRFLQADSFHASYSGAEANVAVSLAQFNKRVIFVSKLPKNDIGQAALNAIRRYGVDTSYIVKGGGRVGVYYVEKGASQRASKVIYDREHSAIAECNIEDFDWNSIFADASWFHFTGITPALSENAYEVCLQACKIAKEKDITISCDINYRKNLWSREQANIKMTELMKYVDLCISNEEDAYDVFGISAENTDIISGKIYHNGYKIVAKKLKEKFGFKYVAITLRESLSASVNNWAGMLFDGRDCFFSKKYPIHIVDRVGGGDSFGAALIYAIIRGYDNQAIIDFAAAASCLKHSIEAGKI